MSLSSSQEEAAIQALAALEAELSQAWINVLGTTPTWGAGNVKAAVVKNLDADRDRIARLGGELLDQVRTDTLPWANWVEIAEVTHQDLAYQLGLTGEWALSGVLRNAVSETGEQLGAGLTSPWTKLAFFGALGVAALYFANSLVSKLPRSRNRR